MTRSRITHIKRNALQLVEGVNPVAFAEIENKAFASAWPESAFSSAGQYHGWSLKQDDNALAFLYMQWVLDEAEILRIAVLPNWRRYGLARQLWQAFLKAAKDKALARVHLEVATSNRAAFAFYANLGFTQTGQRSDYYGPGDHALTMVWTH